MKTKKVNINNDFYFLNSYFQRIEKEKKMEWEREGSLINLKKKRFWVNRKGEEWNWKRILCKEYYFLWDSVWSRRDSSWSVDSWKEIQNLSDKEEYLQECFEIIDILLIADRSSYMLRFGVLWIHRLDVFVDLLVEGLQHRLRSNLNKQISILINGLDGLSP